MYLDQGQLISANKDTDCEEQYVKNLHAVVLIEASATLPQHLLTPVACLQMQ